MGSVRPDGVPPPFKEILKLQKPEIPGQPYDMLPFQNSLPKFVGDPWRGAYSKHGFWYKFHTGGKADFDELAAIATEQDNYMLNYECFTAWQEVYGSENVRIIAAKNLMHHLLPTLSTFGLCKQFGRRFIHVKIDCPSGFTELTPRFLTKVDRAYRVSCFYMETSNDVGSRLDVAELTTASVTGVVQMPVCRYDLTHSAWLFTAVQWTTEKEIE
ncbi:hypothetical protein TELCIR_13824 [Teladorsagia circumcincta]|uniref:Uncharacterized protein n=1 Tax=Teladorsagia circumcincta TaxID=45464 RepID=A0A2G9U2T5_TELCI|nr:hypothetical protein TELCIR_13824 [Teladorsagia circumcincta]